MILRKMKCLVSVLSWQTCVVTQVLYLSGFHIRVGASSDTKVMALVYA